MMGVKGEQLIRELRGEGCLPLEREHRVRQSIMHGRVFGEDTYNLQVVEAAIASLTARATRRLRHDGLLARTAWLSVTTNKHKPNYQKQRICVRLDTPSADGGLIAKQLYNQFAEAYNPRYAYHRADVLLLDLVPDTTLQADLLGYVSIEQHDRSTKRLTAIDAISEKFGQKTIGYAAEKLSQSWQPKRRIRSPRYTTSWNELPTAQLGTHS